MLARSMAARRIAPSSESTLLPAETNAFAVVVMTFEAYAPAAAPASDVVDTEPPVADETEPPTASAWREPPAVAVTSTLPPAEMNEFSTKAST